MSPYRRALSIDIIGSVLLMAILFPIVNALAEELVFRVILFDAVESQLGKVAAVIITSILFGYIHRSGYPPGNLGAILAGIYGCSLACLKILSKGMGLVLIAHIIADITIFSLIILNT